MDGVLADVELGFIERKALETGHRLSFDQIKGKPERANFPKLDEWVLDDRFFRDLAVMPHSQRVVEQLCTRYEVFIVSAATEFPPSLSQKMDWLGAHFPFISWRNICFCGSKTIISADIMIDDHYKNLDPFKGETTLLFNQAHNAEQPDGRHRRVFDWLEIENILL
jgi:5'-nucleotidase